MAEIVMPRLSDTMTEGTVVRWLRGPGDSVRRGEPIVEIETDKATITYEADLDGTIEQILVGEGQTVPVGTTIATIAQDGAAAGGAPPAAPGLAPLPTPEPGPGPLPTPPAEPDLMPAEGGEALPPAAPEPQLAPPGQPLPAEPVPPPVAPGSPPAGDGAATGEEPALTRPSQQMPPAPPPAPAEPAEPVLPEPSPAELEGRVKASPIARRLARKLGIDLATVSGSGPGGRIVKEDVEAAASAQAGGLAEPPPPEPVPEPEPELQAPPPPAQPAPPVAEPVPPQPAVAQAPPAPALPVPPGPPPSVPAPPVPQPGATGGFVAVPPAQAPPAPVGAPAVGVTATRGQATTVDLTQAQQVVARRMAEAKATVPEYQVEVDVDMTAAAALREQLRYGAQPAPSVNDIVVKAAAMALRQFPRVNGAYRDGRFEYYNDVNVGVVVSAGDLLAVPTVFNADQKGLAQIARESHELAAAVRARQIQPAQLAGGTFTVSNLGMFGVPRFNAIINPPQAAILAVGAIQRKPVVAEDGFQLQVRPLMTLTLSVDHRIVYGQEAAEFLGAIKSWLENPHALQI